MTGYVRRFWQVSLAFFPLWRLETTNKSSGKVRRHMGALIDVPQGSLRSRLIYKLAVRITEARLKLPGESLL